MLGSFSPDVQAKSVSKPFLFTKFGDHMVEFAYEQSKLIRANQGHLHVQMTFCDCLRRAAQVVNRLKEKPADHDRGAQPERDSDAANKDGEPLRITVRRRRRKV